MSKHTPGPWSFYTEPQPNGCPIVGTGGLMVCMLAHTVRQPEQRAEALANATLIAAAPEMLEALRKAVVLLAGACVHSPKLGPHETYEAVSAAIAKATGAPLAQD